MPNQKTRDINDLKKRSIMDNQVTKVIVNILAIEIMMDMKNKN
jgi:hypothetical protein